MSARFAPGDAVCVKALFPPGHVRTPAFARGRRGVVARLLGAFENPEALAYGRRGLPPVPLYRVRFRQAELWPDYAGPAEDTLVADIFEHWLEPEGRA
ncbi:MAG TPA: SH3-like domain-containing protein [Geminicoccaceae bacterium]|nr:SH3-like domain-containing protein [Geminicoccaceae bacterium]